MESKKIQKKAKDVMLTGLQATNNLHIGNLFGGIKNLIKFQDEYDLYLFVADLHTLSAVKPDYKNLWSNKINLLASYLASGLDLKKCTIFCQSDVYTHNQLMWILTTISTMGEMYRMTQFKDKSQKAINANGTESVPTGIFTYPILMAADILLYNPKYVPTGIDQKQHVELTRDLAERFNKKFGETFVLPKPLIPEVGAKIMDLVNPVVKMSKSAENANGTIFLLDSPEIATKKIMAAKTDSLNKVKFDPTNQPGISNLLTILNCLTNTPIKDLEKKYKDVSNYGTFKKDVANEIVKLLNNFQNKYNEVMKNPESILSKIKANGEKCLKITKPVIEDVYKKVGLIK